MGYVSFREGSPTLIYFVEIKLEANIGSISISNVGRRNQCSAASFMHDSLITIHKHAHRKRKRCGPKMMETNKVKMALKSPRMNLALRGIVFWCQYLQVCVAKINKPKELLQKNVGTKHKM